MPISKTTKSLTRTSCDNHGLGESTIPDYYLDGIKKMPATKNTAQVPEDKERDPRMTDPRCSAMLSIIP